MASANNLIGTGGGNSGLTNGSNGNQVGVADPGLGTLANNGGPTETIALLAGSPAIDAGSNALAVDPHGSPLTTDQRGAGFPRIVNGTVDIGAFEVQTPTTDNPVPTLSSIQPDRAPAGDTLPISLTVTGSNFLSQSVVYWNSTALSTTFVSSTDVTATIPSSDLTSVGSASITVTTPPLGGGTSTALPFTVVGAPPRSVYVSSAYTGDSTDTPVTWVDGSTHYVGFDAFATIPPAVAALASGGTINILQTGGTDYSGSPDSGNNGLVLSVDNTFTPAGTVPAADTLAFAGDGFVTIFGESAPMNDVFTIKDTSVQFDAADGLHGMTINLAPTVNRDVLGLGNTNTFNIEGLGDSGSSGYLIGNADSSSNAFVFGPFGKLLGNIDGSGTNTLNYSAYSTAVTVNLGNGTNGTATGVSGTVAGITAVIGSNYNDTLSAGSVPGVALTGGLGTNNLSGTGTGDSVVESIASSYTLTNTTLTGAGASFTDNLSGIRVANLTGSSDFGDSFDVSGWTGTGSLAVSSGFSVVTATKNANMTLTNSALVASDGMSLSLSHIVIAELTATASAGDPKDIIDASAFSGFAALSATGTVNAVLYGGSGAGDTLTAAGSGNDILIGDAGRDTLIDSGTGHNILIGAGSGGNTVTGNGNDILVGGTTVYDSNSGCQYRGPGRHPGRMDLECSLRKADQHDREGSGLQTSRRAQLPHDPSGCERQLPLRRENSAPELQLVPRQQTGQCYEETQRNQDHHLAATQAEMVPASAGDNRIGWMPPVGQRPPEPLGRAEAEVLEPDRADDELEDPDGQHDRGQSGAVDLAEEAEAIAVEERRADDRVGQVVGKGHAAHRGQPAGEPTDRAALHDQHEQPHVTQGHDQAAEHVVEDAAVHHVIDRELVLDQLDGVEDHQRQADSVAQADHPPVESPRPLGGEDPQLHQAHAHEHPAHREEPASEEEPEDLVLQELGGPMLDDPEITAAIDGHLFVPILGLLLGAGQNLVPEILGPEIVQHVVDPAVLLAGLDLGLVPGRRGLHVIDARGEAQDQAARGPTWPTSPRMISVRGLKLRKK